MNGLNEAQNKVKISLLNYFSSNNKDGLDYEEMDKISSSFIDKYFSGVECDARIELINNASSKSVMGGLSSKSISDYRKVNELSKTMNGIQR